MNEFVLAVQGAFHLYPEIEARIDNISVSFDLEHGLGRLSILERDFFFGFNEKNMSLDTVHHEVAHMVCYCLDLPLDHGKDFLAIKDKILAYCVENEECS